MTPGCCVNSRSQGEFYWSPTVHTDEVHCVWSALLVPYPCETECVTETTCLPALQTGCPWSRELCVSYLCCYGDLGHAHPHTPALWSCVCPQQAYVCPYVPPRLLLPFLASAPWFVPSSFTWVPFRGLLPPSLYRASLLLLSPFLVSFLCWESSPSSFAFCRAT